MTGAELIAVSDPDAARMNRVVERNREARAVADPFEVIRDPRVQAILVASPDETHAAMILACLDQKPVFCEKPLAPTVQDCRSVVSREEALGRRLVMVGYMRRFDPGYVEMKRQLDSGEFGEALLMHGWHRNATAQSYLTGATLIANAAVHEMDISRFLLGCESAGSPSSSQESHLWPASRTRSWCCWRWRTEFSSTSRSL